MKTTALRTRRLGVQREQTLGDQEDWRTARRIHEFVEEKTKLFFFPPECVRREVFGFLLNVTDEEPVKSKAELQSFGTTALGRGRCLNDYVSLVA